MTRVLILGASGRLGTFLRRAWSRGATGIDPIYQYRRSAPPEGVLWHPGDDTARLPQADAIVALWGVTSGTTDALEMNASLAEEAGRIAAGIGAKTVFHFSSAAVYGPTERPATEEAPLRQSGAYGLAKLEMERVLHGLRGPACHVALRLGNVVGGDSLRAALEGTRPATLDQFPDGRGPLRSYISPVGLSSALVRLTKQPPTALPPVLNLAAPRPLHMDALLLSAGRSWTWRPAPGSGVQQATICTSRLASLLPGLSLADDPATLIAEWQELSQ
ncbi:NAD dependent epimerase/dehydratase family protein [Poseidonocella pacifica]|uniref:NAD dependent epimerase/dehydratase family protein n=1 Tax=Poseidonocella pacifica TaxID=871651 RepID=A0A1I0Y0Y6_9RHOB|nr:NAD(P)-dependent oxidoreductase [Poseidonocella pacifica]SFB06148.1 NAD dependent epimerase/dehydratase family protein [Poseidonocella pacifica]